MTISKNISLLKYNSFGIEASAKFFASFHSTDELAALTTDRLIENYPMLILGGGSNILLTKNFDGFVLKNELKGIELVKEDANYYYVKAWAGENWHQFVLHCIKHAYAGVENLSLIPGNVGASPMQNIGAYGVEIKDIFHGLEAWDLEERKTVLFTLNDCEFGYRESVFKKQYKNRFVILNVTYRLSKQPVYHIEYGAIKEELERMNLAQLSIRAVSDAVINIRSSKLPDPQKIGNAGSFFKNPVISAARFEGLKKNFPSIPGYPAGEDIKTAAGWLIEQCGWKGFRNGDAGCYDKQALVLVNYGSATGQDIFSLSQSIINSVQDKFSITLEREVNII